VSAARRRSRTEGALAPIADVYYITGGPMLLARPLSRAPVSFVRGSFVRAAVAVAFMTLAWSTPAAAHGAAPPAAELTVSDLAPSPLKRSLLDVQQKMREADHDPSLVAEPVQEAVRAAERAQGARASGDKRNGNLLTKIGEQWAKVAAALLRAASSEAAATQSATRLRGLTTKLERSDALLAEQQARFGRLQAELRKRESREHGAATRAADKERKRVGAKGKSAKKKAPTKGSK